MDDSAGVTAPSRTNHIPPITLRPINSQDRELLYRIYASTREDELSVLNWDETQKKEFLRLQFEAQHAHYMEHFADATFDLIMLNGSPVGRLYLDRRDDEIRIIDIALLTEFRGKGIGSRLMLNILSEAKLAGCPVRIHVERNNHAMRLYERLGFKSIEDKGVYLLMEWTPRAE